MNILKDIEGNIYLNFKGNGHEGIFTTTTVSMQCSHFSPSRLARDGLRKYYYYGY